MKGLYRKLIPLLLALVLCCLLLNYSFRSPSSPAPSLTHVVPVTSAVVPVTSAATTTVPPVAVVVKEKKKIAYAITITKDGTYQ
jgi:hypothetical protein